MAARRSEEDDDYWDKSSASNIKAKGINLFDESVGLETARNFLKTSTFGDEDSGDDDVINWDGSTVSYEKPAAAQRSGSRPAARPTGLSTTRGVTAVPAAPVYKPMPEPVGRSEHISIDDVVSRAVPRKEPTAQNIAKLEAEVVFLKRSLQAAKSEKFSRMPAEETARKMVMGQLCTLEMYKAKEDKLQLLDATIKLHDGNAITRAVLFLRDTVKSSIFKWELQMRPAAVEHYLNFLRINGDAEIDHLLDMLSFLGRNEEAAILGFRKASSVREASAKIKKLRACHSAHFQDPRLAHESSAVLEYIGLLERQQPVEDADAQDERKGAAIFREIPRMRSIIDMPVITTLFYCGLYHYGKDESFLASPAAIRKAHKLTEKQVLWTAIRARGKIKHWLDVEQLFVKKGWLGGTKMKSVIGFDRIVYQLKKIRAPRDVLNKYCNLIDDLDLRMQVGHKCACYESVVETLMHQKDRQQLIAYQKSLRQNSQEWFFAADMLRNSSIKWKN